MLESDGGKGQLKRPLQQVCACWLKWCWAHTWSTCMVASDIKEGVRCHYQGLILQTLLISLQVETVRGIRQVGKRLSPPDYTCSDGGRRAGPRIYTDSCWPSIGTTSNLTHSPFPCHCLPEPLRQSLTSTPAATHATVSHSSRYTTLRTSLTSRALVSSAPDLITFCSRVFCRIFFFLLSFVVVAVYNLCKLDSMPSINLILLNKVSKGKGTSDRSNHYVCMARPCGIHGQQ